jgi:hypothetical protein
VSAELINRDPPYTTTGRARQGWACGGGEGGGVQLFLHGCVPSGWFEHACQWELCLHPGYAAFSSSCGCSHLACRIHAKTPVVPRGELSLCTAHDLWNAWLISGCVCPTGLGSTECWRQRAVNRALCICLEGSSQGEEGGGCKQTLHSKSDI